MLIKITILIIFILCCGFFLKKENKYEGICAFDIDKTLTISNDKTKGVNKKDVHRRALDAILHCKKRNCKIIINTARVPKTGEKKVVISDLPEMIKNEITDEDIYHGENYNFSVLSDNALDDLIAENKARNLEKLAILYGLPYNKVILFDDLYSNIKKCKEKGFSVVHANYPSGGLRPDTYSQVDKILSV